MEKKGSSKMNVAIIHPDLGIGGAERLIVDAAMELASLGHKVHIFTSHHDKNRCFEETLSGVFDITVYGSFLPRHIFYRLHAVCAYLRCMFVSLCLLFMWPSFDIILADQVSVVIPLLKLKKSAKVVFYCHFPDLLLAQHTTILRRIYRKPIDFIEEITTGMADLILVNSKFTASTFASTFKNLDARGIKPAVLYPAVNVDQFEKPNATKLNFLSINRFERKKNIELAISAFAMLHAHEVHDHQGVDMNDVSLTVAGKFIQFFKFSCKNSNIPLEVIVRANEIYEFVLCVENVEYLEELKKLAEREGVSQRVKFITSCSTAERNALLGQCLCVLYTPKDEHFGIVPLEAMAAYKPVIACNSGGPVETVKHGVTGFLCDPNPKEFASAMSNFIQDPHLSEKMGQDARQHVAESFSTKIFGQHLNRYLVDVARGKEE
ncbi:putative carboxylesterase 4-like [Capsicum annuum]|nr:putative carboxylesterase 4-like [Capsicum annuum]